MTVDGSQEQRRSLREPSRPFPKPPSMAQPDILAVSKPSPMLPGPFQPVDKPPPEESQLQANARPLKAIEQLPVGQQEPHVTPPSVTGPHVDQRNIAILPKKSESSEQKGNPTSLNPTTQGKDLHERLDTNGQSKSSAHFTDPVVEKKKSWWQSCCCLIM